MVDNTTRKKPFFLSTKKNENKFNIQNVAEMFSGLVGSDLLLEICSILQNIEKSIQSTTFFFAFSEVFKTFL